MLADIAAAIARDAPAEDLRTLAAQLAQEQGATARRIAELEAFEAENVLDASDEDLDANAGQIVRARRLAARLDKAAERLARHSAGSEAREKEAQRLERYQAAAALATNAEAWILQDYAAHAAAIGAGLVRLGEIADALELANDDRPKGAPLLSLEGCRALLASPDRTEFRAETYYVDTDGDEVVPSDELPLMQDNTGAFFIGAVPRRSVFARERQVPVNVPGRPQVQPRPLAAAVNLPGVAYADPDFWPRRSKLWGL